MLSRHAAPRDHPPIHKEFFLRLVSPTPIFEKIKLEALFTCTEALFTCTRDNFKSYAGIGYSDPLYGYKDSVE